MELFIATAVITSNPRFLYDYFSTLGREGVESTVDKSEWLASRPGSFAPEERAAGTRRIRGVVGPRADMNSVEGETFPPLSGIEPLYPDRLAFSLITTWSRKAIANRPKKSRNSQLTSREPNGGPSEYKVWVLFG
jgi:hypothetical protein